MTRFFILIAFLTVLAVPAAAQERDTIGNTSFGFRFGYTGSSGEWNTVRYAPGVKLLTPGITAGADVTFALSDRVGLVLNGSFQRFDGSDWEEYTASRGDVVRVSATCFSVAVLLRPYLGINRPNLVWIEFGPAALFPSGEESINGSVYQYDFFSSTKFGGEGAIAYERMIGEQTAVMIRAGALVFPTGFSYADGQAFTMTVFPVSAGIRLYY
jgi:hypothetical protein